MQGLAEYAEIFQTNFFKKLKAGDTICEHVHRIWTIMH